MPSSYNPPAWGQPLYKEFIVPSGGTCLVKKVEPIDLISDETLGAVDMLGGIVMDQIKRAQTPGNPTLQAAYSAKMDEERMDAILKAMQKPENLPKMIDRITMMAVVEPVLHVPPARYEDRIDERTYIDALPFDDKMAIFNHAMSGMSALTPFREQSDEGVGTVDASAGVPCDAEPPAQPG